MERAYSTVVMVDAFALHANESEQQQKLTCYKLIFKQLSAMDNVRSIYF